MARHRYRSPILDRNAEDLGSSGCERGELVGKRGCQDSPGRAAIAGSRFLGGVNLGIRIHIGAFGQKAIVGILDVVDGGAGLAIEPDIADHPVGRGVSAGRQGHVADDGFRVGMSMVGVVVVDTLLEQVAQPAFPDPVEVARWQVAPKLVYGDLENKPGLLERR